MIFDYCFFLGFYHFTSIFIVL
ncbi:cellulose synthase-like protein [Francisella orientalis str. Toba 04]|nr:cellulose synthase-like protein [Francisella orientalis str. Toba 04]